MSILVIDDDFESRMVLTELLAAEGFKVGAADGGELALASFPAERPELILLDIRMPGMDWLEVGRRLTGNANTRDVPVILIGPGGGTADRLTGFRPGAVDFISKPFERAEVLARVTTHLELAKTRAQLEERTAELCECEKRFRAMADGAPAMIWITDTDKLCTFVNRGWLQFTGRSVNEELGHGWSEGVHPDDQERCRKTYFASCDSRVNFEMEYRYRRADGEYRWLLDHGVPHFSPEGIFSGYVGTCTDITDLKRTHEAMLASQKLESLGVMAAGVAHDFGNLLGTILCETDLGLSDMAPDAPGRESIRRIAMVATRATAIVRMLMDSAGASGSSAGTEPVDLSFQIEQIFQLLSVSISKRAVVYRSLPEGLPAVWGNISQIHQVVMNLVTNASEALGGQPGFITVTAEEAHLAEGAGSDLFSLPAGDYVRLKVADTGCGMTAETRARIFDPFFTTKSPGRGLGLASVHGIVRSYGGAIRVESAPGAGTTFEVLFPCAG